MSYRARSIVVTVLQAQIIVGFRHAVFGNKVCIFETGYLVIRIQRLVVPQAIDICIANQITFAAR
jgi:hypothetical protein